MRNKMDGWEMNSTLSIMKESFWFGLTSQSVWRVSPVVGLARLVEPIQFENGKSEFPVPDSTIGSNWSAWKIRVPSTNRFGSSGWTNSVGKMENLGFRSLVQLSVQIRSTWKIMVSSTNRFGSSGWTDSVSKMENLGFRSLVQLSVKIVRTDSNRFVASPNSK